MKELVHRFLTVLIIFWGLVWSINIASEFHHALFNRKKSEKPIQNASFYPHTIIFPDYAMLIPPQDIKK